MNPSPTTNSVWLSVQRIEELKNIEVIEGEILIGSGLSIRQAKVYMILSHVMNSVMMDNYSEFLEAVRFHCNTEQYVTAIDSLYAKYSSDQVKNTAVRLQLLRIRSITISNPR